MLLLDYSMLAMLGPDVSGTYLALARPWLMRWAATADEMCEALPGDALVQRPLTQATRAVTVRASAAEVWQWLGHLGQEAGSRYSYDWRHNVLRLGLATGGDLYPDGPGIALGDRVWLAPPGDGNEERYLEVAAADPERLLVLRTPINAAGVTAPDLVRTSWAFVLREVGGSETRLIVRLRSDQTFGAATTALSSRGDTLLDAVLLDYEFRGAVSVGIAATPAQVFAALRAVTLAELPLTQALGEIPNRELVLGAAGRFHDLVGQQCVPLSGWADWEAFADPGGQKLAFSFRVEHDGAAGGSRLTLEHRTHALSEASRRDFAWYWLLIEPARAVWAQLLLRAVKTRAEA